MATKKEGLVDDAEVKEVEELKDTDNTKAEITKKKENIDLEELTKNIYEQVKAEEATKRALEEEKVKKEAKDQENKALLEKTKKFFEQTEEINKETDKKIVTSRLEAENEDLKTTMKIIMEKLEETTKQNQIEKEQKEILKKIDKEPYLKEIVLEWLNNGKIKSIEDYDDMVTKNKHLRETLKKAYELDEKLKTMGADPESEIGGSRKDTKKDENWTVTAEKKYQEKIFKKLGIKRK